MPDKIETVRTSGRNFRTVETQAVKLFGRFWIGPPECPRYYDSAAGLFSMSRDFAEKAWHLARIRAALKRHPECR